VTRGVVGGEGEAGKTTVLCGGGRAFVVGFALKNGKKRIQNVELQLNITDCIGLRAGRRGGAAKMRVDKTAAVL